MAQGRGWEGTVLRLMRAKDFTLTVTRAEDVTPRYRRLRLADGGLLAATGIHPAMWVRLWFTHTGRPHQRAYTLVDPDPAAGAFSLEFALHEGAAGDWARAARPGDTIEATVQGTRFEEPAPAPTHVLAVGDPAALPAINSVLDAFDPVPATIWFADGRPDLPFRTDAARHDLRHVSRGELPDRVRAELPGILSGTAHPYVWITSDTRTTRTLSAYVRRELGVPRDRVHALGYWRAD
ncbi:siderophore-interacting protein [Streptomyces sp. NPDC101225]|uniref:siderophore-interacting protein n=1 Tax=Streptomyces sp. NPDC101225 TaxID=3366135 RepID=UPI003801938E